MLRLSLTLLTGRYVATHFNDRMAAEWPPHPARVFSALIAAHYDAEQSDPREREALRWLAAEPPPVIWAANAEHRVVFPVYVPTNDAAALKSIDKQLAAVTDAELALQAGDAEPESSEWRALEKAFDKAATKLDQAQRDSARADGKAPGKATIQILPGSRSRQPRTFPSVQPTNPRVDLVWDSEPAPQLLAALDRIARRVTRVGHSSSLVAAIVTTFGASDDGRERWSPDDAGTTTLRVLLPDLLERSDELHKRHQQVEPRVLPCRFQKYRVGSEAGPVVKITRSVFEAGGWLLYALDPAGDGRRFDASLAEPVARALRGAVLGQLDAQAPSSLTGHDAEGAARVPHVAFVPLPFVGHFRATGLMLGVAIVPPRGMRDEERTQLLAAIASAEADDGAITLTLGRRGTARLVRAPFDARATLGAPRWTGPARRWATATPIALDRNPGNLLSRDPAVADAAAKRAEGVIAQACQRIDLPAPEAVWVHRRSVLDGAPAARRFSPFPASGKGTRRVCVHAEVVFPEPVVGPVLLGAGRFFGVGLLAPMEESR